MELFVLMISGETSAHLLMIFSSNLSLSAFRGDLEDIVKSAFKCQFILNKIEHSLPHTSIHQMKFQPFIIEGFVKNMFINHQKDPIIQRLFLNPLEKILSDPNYTEAKL